MSNRNTLALPIDVARLFDSTVTQAVINSNAFQGSGDDEDLLESLIEDAEDEFRAATETDMRVARVGVAGQRSTYEHITYDVSGHQAYKRNWSGVTTDYRPTEVTTSLDNDRILPFDSTAGDECYIYRGLSGASSGSQWEDVTDDQGDLWDILNYGKGQIVFHPVELHRAMLRTRRGVAFGGAGQLRELRVAISYRYGGLGGSRGRSAQTALDEDINDTQTDAVTVTDGSGFPVGNSPGSIIVLVGREYMEVNPDPSNSQMELAARGVRGTTAASHSSGDRVQYTPPTVRKAVASRAAMQLISSSAYSDWLPDTEDSLDKSERYDTLEETWNMTVDALSG